MGWYVDYNIYNTIMAFKGIGIGSNLRVGADAATGEYGMQVKIVNGSATATVKGFLYAPSGSEDNKYIPQTDELDVVYVCYEAGVAQNSSFWAWMHGSKCQVLYKENTASTRKYACVADATDGYASDVDIASIPNHYKEVGQVCESKAAGGAGTYQIVLIDFHTL
jgi:uncharacterized membrane protein